MNSAPRSAEIIKIGHPVLREGTRPVSPELFGSHALNELIDVMRVTLNGKGVGLAAPQIAVPLRLFVIEDTEDRMQHLSVEQRRDRHRHPHPFEAVINPTWRATSARIAIEPEGCLSIPGFRADIPRFWAIEAEGYTAKGERKRWSLEGWPARIFQHEIDHLDGLLLTDRMLAHTLASTEPFGTGVDAELLVKLGVNGH
ncbi:peptide deformylase [Bradyrhizobium sp. SYSU BS000235]|uniref:peptide deformylase n=1 Tax=Bradyrhizobium sp. SYSU BS000235 TaxID=3411332 RepID=UPI003C7121D4